MENSRLQRIEELKELIVNSNEAVIKLIETYDISNVDVLIKRKFGRDLLSTLETMSDSEYVNYTEPTIESYCLEVPFVGNTILELKKLLNSQIENLSDEDAKSVPTLFPVWADFKNQTINIGTRVGYNGQLYKCITQHEGQSTGTPMAATSLGKNISEEAQEADGSIEHPYTWEIGMTSYEGKYYTENNKLYLCTRDSIDPLNFSIADLINIYFSEVVN